MGKLEATVKSEIMRLAKRELHKVSVPLKREVRLLRRWQEIFTELRSHSPGTH